MATKKSMFPREFVEWKDSWFYCIAGVYFEKQIRDDVITSVFDTKRYFLDDLYYYWLENFKNKEK